MAQIYRKTALDKISSPEQLDKTLKITSPLSWLVLIGVTLIVVVGVIWSFMGSMEETITLEGVLVEPNGVCSVFAEESGKLMEIKPDINGVVHLGQEVMIYTTDSDRERHLLSNQAGTVYSIIKKGGSAADGNTNVTIKAGDEILRITPNLPSQKYVAVCYASSKEAEKIRTRLENARRGMDEEGRPVERTVKATVAVTKSDSQKYGHLEAQVFAVDSAAAEEKADEIWGGAHKDEKAKARDKIAIICEITSDPSSASGLKWSSEKGKTQTVNLRDLVTVKIVTSEEKPIFKFFSKLKDIWEGKEKDEAA